jgi:hypothetical protein
MADIKTSGAGLRQLQTYPNALQFVSQLTAVDLNKVAAIAVQLKALMDAGAMASIDASEEACSVFDDLHAVVDNLLEASAAGVLAVTSSKPVPLTKPISFFACGTAGDGLFAVPAGIPVMDALNGASCILDISKHLANSAAEKFDNAFVWSLSYQIEMAKAALDAAISGLDEEANHG